MESSTVKIVSTEQTDFHQLRQRIHDQHAAEQRSRCVRRNQHPHDRRQHSRRRQSCPPMPKRSRVSNSAQRRQDQSTSTTNARDDHDGFRRGELEQFQIIHCAPPFLQPLKQRRIETRDDHVQQNAG